MSWAEAQMGDFFRVKHGYAFKGEFFDSQGSYVLLTPGSFNEEGGFRDQGEKTKYYTGDVPDGFVLDESDVVVAMTEQAPGLLGSSAWIPEDGRFLHNQRLGRIVNLDEHRLSKRYLYYLFNSRGVRVQISATATGGKVRHTAPERIAKVRFALPPLGVQNHIAHVLSDFDNLIENNRRRMALLQEAAQHLHREWFVRFRFPGYEHTRITNGVPEGWEKTVLGSRFHTVLGGTPSRTRPDYWENGTVPWINSGKVNELRVIEASEFITEKALNASAAKLMPCGATLLAITGATLGQVSFLEIECSANQSVVGIIDPSGLRSEFLYLTMRNRIDELVARATGGAQVHINKDIVNAFEIVLPHPRLAIQFKEQINPVFRQVASLMFQNEKLRAARNLLLPRLMSGEITV